MLRGRYQPTVKVGRSRESKEGILTECEIRKQGLEKAQYDALTGPIYETIVEVLKDPELRKEHEERKKLWLEAKRAGGKRLSLHRVTE